MAKKTRKKTTKNAAARPTKKSKPARKSVPKAKPRKRKTKAKPATIGARLSDAYHAVVDTVKGTGKLRDRLEKPGTSETE